MNLSNVDLDLFLVLHTVLEERSATRAAARLHVTRPAVSNALARLRQLFGDPLVRRTARGLVPTPVGAQIAPLLASALEQLRIAIEQGRAFDPARSTRRFTIACTDYEESVVVPALIPRFARYLPQASLRVVTIEHLLVSNGLVTGDVDLVIGLQPVLPPGCAAEPLFTDGIVCVVRKDHPRIRDRVTLDTFFSTPQVEVAHLGGARTTGRAIMTEALAVHGRLPAVAISVPRFSSAVMAVASSDWMAVLPERFVASMAAQVPLRVLPAPFKLPSLPIQAIWHARSDADEGVKLVRRLAREAVDAAPDEHRALQRRRTRGARTR
ncbi:Transcriptional regulator [Minicystis rosea]|nr:Transcriptional regulator [Minicystis rosea]